MPIPLRNFGKTGVQISALGLGGHHLGGAKDEKTAIEIVHPAVDGGITFYDKAWGNYCGKTDASLATQMLEQSLRRLQTDHLDLWQIHGVVFQNDPALFIRPGGAAEALLTAKEQGKVRFVGFTGHKDPNVHLAMLNTGFPFDSVQMPLNAFDATYFMSFEQKVLPVLNQRGIAPLGMKPISGHGDPVQRGVLSASEALRYAMSLPVACTISGAEEPHIIEQNLEIAQNFQPMTAAEMQALRDRCRPYAADGRFELYKSSLKFDNPEARLVHDFPLDTAQVEVKDMIKEADDTGHAWPQV